MEPHEVPTKYCVRCHQDKPATADFFHRDSTQSDGLGHWCRECRTEYQRERRREMTPEERRDRKNEQGLRKVLETQRARTKAMERVVGSLEKILTLKPNKVPYAAELVEGAIQIVGMENLTRALASHILNLKPGAPGTTTMFVTLAAWMKEFGGYGDEDLTKLSDEDLEATYLNIIRPRIAQLTKEELDRDVKSAAG